VFSKVIGVDGEGEERLTWIHDLYQQCRRPASGGTPAMTSTTPTRILILGGGFGGVYTTLTLEKILKRELKRGVVVRKAARLSSK
jgi:hypothetical protein